MKVDDMIVDIIQNIALVRIDHGGVDHMSSAHTATVLSRAFSMCLIADSNQLHLLRG